MKCVYCGEVGARTVVLCGFSHKKCIPPKATMKIKKSKKLRDIIGAPYFPIFGVTKILDYVKEDLRKCCPKCHSDHYSSTYVGYTGRNENKVKCEDCGWKGEAYQLKKQVKSSK